MSNRVTDRIADQLSESLRHQADRIPPGPSLADPALRQARRIRRNRRIGTVAAGCLAVLAIAIPLGIGNAYGSKNDIAPVERPTIAQREQADPVRVNLDIQELPEGDPAGVPYYSASDHAIHDGDRTVSIGRLELTTNGESMPFDERGTGPVVSFSPTRNGYLLHAMCCEGIGVGDRRSWLLDVDGRVLREFASPTPPVLAPDGRTIAAAGYEDDRYERGYLYTVDAGTGERLARSAVTNGNGPAPVGFVGDRVVFDDSSVPPEWTAVWDPITNTIARPNEPPTPDPPAGRELVVRGGASGQQYTVVDVSDGREVLRISGPEDVDQPVMAGADVLFVASDGSDQALVRCGLDGGCERASGRQPGAPYATGLSLASPDGQR